MRLEGGKPQISSNVTDREYTPIGLSLAFANTEILIKTSTNLIHTRNIYKCGPLILCYLVNVSYDIDNSFCQQSALNSSVTWRYLC